MSILAALASPAVLGSLIGAGAGLAGTGLDFMMGSLTNSANAEQAHKNRLHQIRMAKNRYQWTVEDMRKAGINPIYSVQGGSAPGIGSGSAIPMQNPLRGNPIQNALSVAHTILQMRNEKKVADSQAFLNQASAEANLSTSSYNDAKTIEQLTKNKYADEYTTEQIKDLRARGQNEIWKNIINENEAMESMGYYQSRTDKMRYDAWTAKNQYESLKNPTFNRVIGYGSDSLSLVGDVVSSALGIGKIGQFFKVFKRARGW